MPVEAPADPTQGAATDVTQVAASAATAARDQRNPRERVNQRSKNSQEARAKVDQVARAMAENREADAKSFLLGTPAPEPKAVTSTPAASEAKVEETKEAPKEPTAEEKAAAAEKSKKVAAAKRALALDGWEPEDIAALKDDKLLSIGAHRAKNQADVNREFDRLRKSATSPTGARNEDGTFATKPAEAAADAAPAPKPSEKVETTAPKTAEAYGDQQIDAMIKAVEEDIGAPAAKLLKVINATYAQRLAQAEEKVKSQGEIGSAHTMELLYGQGRDMLEEQYPEQMAKSEAFDEVAENFRALVSSGRYGLGQVSKAWRDAGFMTFGAADPVRKAQRDALARQEAADKGRVDSGKGDKSSSSPSNVKAMSRREQLNVAAGMLASNPNANLDQLHTQLMTRLKSGRAA